MVRKKITPPTSQFLPKSSADKLKAARGAWAKSPHTQNKKRLKTMLSERNIPSLREFAFGATGLKAVRDLRDAAGAIRGTTDGMASQLAETMKRYPEFRKEVAKLGGDYLYFNSKGEPMLVKGDRLIGKARFRKEGDSIKLGSKKPFGIGRFRMQLKEMMDRATPEYIQGTMGGQKVSFVRYGEELRIFNQITGAEEKYLFSKFAKVELKRVEGGREIIIVLSNGKILKIFVPDKKIPKGADKKTIEKIKQDNKDLHEEIGHRMGLRARGQKKFDDEKD